MIAGITFCLLICFGGDKPVTVSEFCQVSSLIRLERGESRKLSLETNRQIAKHNRKYHQLCDKPERRK